MTTPDTNASAAKPAAKAPVYMVFDTNQRGDLPRRHEVIIRVYPDGREPDVVTYALFSAENKPCPMPIEHAMKFLCDRAFRVISPRGDRIQPIEKQDLSKPIKVLAVDEIVVKYHDLSRESLFKRVKMLAGSEDVKQNATVDELAGFLIKWREGLKGMTDGEKAVAEMMAGGDLGGKMDDAMLGKMFGEQKAA